MNRVGHAFFKTRMREEDAVFGGEVSGHYYFRDFYCADSGTIPALLILELLSTQRRDAVRAARALPLALLHLRRDQLRGRRPATRRSRSSPSATPTRRQYRLDGLSVDYDDWHFNVRPSNTEPLLRLCLESLRSREDMERRRDEVLGRDPFVSTGEPPPESRRRGGARARRRAGIHRLAIPTPFLVGRVNCYLIEDEPLTLVDTGPNSGKSLDELERALAEHGHAIEDLELIVITHQHMDHLGLLEILARRSGAEVAALHLLGPYLENFAASATADDEFAQAVMRRHGVPDDLATVLGAVGRGVPGVRLERPGDTALRDGDTLDVPRPHAAGAAPPRPQPLGHGLLGRDGADPDRRRPPARAHLLQPAGLAAARRASRPAQRPQALLALHRVDARDARAARRARAGRPRRADHRPRRADRRAAADARAPRAQDARMLDAGPLTAYEIALQMWGNVAVTQAYLTISEVLGHMDLLRRDGRVREVGDGDVIRSRRSTGAGYAELPGLQRGDGRRPTLVGALRRSIRAGSRCR